MKRFFLPTIILAVLAVGCVKSNIIESSPSYHETIEFESYAGRIPVTKASNVTIDVIKDEEVGFQAIAYSSGDNSNLYLNERVTYDANAGEDGQGKWVYGTKKVYWPESSNLDFVAYGLNAQKTGKVSNVEEVKLISDLSEASFIYSVPDSPKEQEDLVVAEPWFNHNNKTEHGNVVTFDFKHVLTKIGFSIYTNNEYTGENANAVDVTIKNISLKGTFYNRGVVHLLAQTPNIEADKTSSYVTSYSLFGHNYRPAVEKEEGEGEEEGGEGEEGEEGEEEGEVKVVLLDGFVCHNTKEIVPIYPNIQFNADEKEYEEVDVPASVDQNALDNRFMMIIPGTLNRVADVDDINGNGITNEPVDPYIEVVYQLTGGADVITRAYLSEYGITEFEAGKWYEFIFKVSTTAVKFEVDITQGWNTEEDPLGSDEENTESNS